MAPSQSMYDWALVTIINRRKQEKGLIPSWVPPPKPAPKEGSAAGSKRRRGTDAPHSGAGVPDGEDGGGAGTFEI